jgi:hypothetical protein
VHAVLLSVEKQQRTKRGSHIPFFQVSRSCWGASFFCCASAIRGLGVPFVGNDKNKASNHSSFTKKKNPVQPMCFLPVKPAENPKVYNQIFTDLSAAGRPAKLKHIAQRRKRKQP